jgi:hypothetical protein
MVALSAENRRERFLARACSGTSGIRETILGHRMLQNAIWCTVLGELFH